MSRKHKKRHRGNRRSAQAEGNYCEACSKIAWSAAELAEREVQRLRAEPGVSRSELIDAYRCQHGIGWHVGHNYKLKWISLCVGKHR